jgi:hypothetical protein
MSSSAAVGFFTEEAKSQLDDLLYEVCRDLQLSSSRYKLAEERYGTIARALEADASPFRLYQPLIYPQGSMRLGTTVKPVDGPHDLDLVCELALLHWHVQPIPLLDSFYEFLRTLSAYRGMLSRKNRCVRITYADEFHLDILPACKDQQAGGTCIRVPDRELEAWSPSNPVGYAEWFEKSSCVVRRLVAAAMPLARQQDADQKNPLQLCVQLIKRWRDRHFEEKLKPASIVLTTLAARSYAGQESVTDALSGILTGILDSVAQAEQQGQRIVVLNPSNPREDLSERWNGNHEAYQAFKAGMASLFTDWRAVTSRRVSAHGALEQLFGEPVRRAILSQARRLQKARRSSGLGVTAAGIIAAVGPTVVPIRPNTFHGKA